MSPHRAEKDIEWEIREIREIIETHNLAPYKLKTYKDQLKKMEDHLATIKKKKAGGGHVQKGNA
jgi:AraC-like DNA-binding protein